MRGRSGRQGDPGASKFFLSLEDDLMRIFGSDRMDGLLKRLGLKEGEAIIHAWINKALEKAQQKVEARNYEIRKNLLRFDDVMNDQRKVIYEQRIELITADDVADTVADMRREIINDLVATRIPENAYAEKWDGAGLADDVRRIFAIDLPIADWVKEEGIANEAILDRLNEAVDKRMAEKTANFGPETMRMVEKSLLLQLLDQQWKDHLLHLDHLRQAIYLRAYAQKDPLNEYKREAFGLFESMLAGLREGIVSLLARIEVQQEPPPELFAQPSAPFGTAIHADPTTGENEMADEVDPNNPATFKGTPRNAPCPCGSGKKYKHCHGSVV